MLSNGISSAETMVAGFSFCLRVAVLRAGFSAGVLVFSVGVNDYLADFDFGDAEITTYFRRYKKIKLCNVNDEDFKNHVRELALTRPYNRFETRKKFLEDADKNSKLYWLDALGVEFLSYIKARAIQLELSAAIKIARAELPTLTSQNKNFYDE